MFEKICENLLKNGIDISKKRVIAGISGGPDSTLLFNFLLFCRERHHTAFRVVHMNHLERDAADDEERFVRELCKDRSVEGVFLSDDSNAGKMRKDKGFEMAAREARRRIFLEEACRFRADFVMTGHNLDDAVETLLINVERGSGIRGIASNKLKSGIFIKPLIFLRKREISDFLDSRKIGYVTDETNSDESMARNRIRRRVMPVLDGGLKNGIRDFGKLIENTSSVLDAFDWIIEHETKILRSRNPFILDISKFLYYNNKLRKNLLYYIISRDFNVDSALIERIDALMLSKKANIILREKNLKIVKSYDELKLEKSYLIYGDRKEELTAGETLHFNGYEVKIEKVLIKDCDPASGEYMLFPFEAGETFNVRTPKTNDEFIPFGMKTGKKVARFLMNAKVPLEERRVLPLLVNEREEILAVGLHRRTDMYRINKQKRCYRYYARKS